MYMSVYMCMYLCIYIYIYGNFYLITHVIFLEQITISIIKGLVT